jgi:hypothetical protein
MNNEIGGLLAACFVLGLLIFLGIGIGVAITLDGDNAQWRCTKWEQRAYGQCLQLTRLAPTGSI